MDAQHPEPVDPDQFPDPGRVAPDSAGQGDPHTDDDGPAAPGDDPATPGPDGPAASGLDSAAASNAVGLNPAAMSPAGTDDPRAGDQRPSKGRLIRAIAVYTAIRVGILAVLTAALMWVMPLIVALAFAVVLQLPLALLLFPRQRGELTAALAQVKAKRTAERDRLRAALTGEPLDDA